MPVICTNGDFIDSDLPVIKSTNRSYRYGAGLFETIKVKRGEIIHLSRHLERLFNGITVLKLNPPSNFTTNSIRELILAVCRKNQINELGRIRLSVSAGNGGIDDSQPGFEFIIESWPLSTAEEGSKVSFEIGIYQGARKSCDVFSNLKSASFLPYFMAASFATVNGWDDAIILNSHGRIADSSIANVFIIKKNEIITPPLSEGCVSGITRGLICDDKSLLEKSGYHLVENNLTPGDLQFADEIFLTNAIRGIIPVKKFENKAYPNRQTSEINLLLSSTINP